MREEIAKAQRLAAKIAARQYGVLSLEQLLWAGLTRSTISRRLADGWLHRLHRGVYAVGHTDLSREGRWLAAVLACGKGAVLSHHSAAALWKLSPTCPALVHVSVPGRSGRAKRPGIRLHYSTTLTAAQVTRRRNIPVTTQARTLRDLGWGPERTRSDLERVFLRICRDHVIPAPEVNVRLGPYEVDFLWREARLVVEVDGYAYHADRRAFRADRARDRELESRGFTVLRFADEELEEVPGTVGAALRARLGTGG